MTAAKPSQNGSFYQNVSRAFYAQVKQQNGGSLPKNLQDADGNPRKLTKASSDRVYRQQWKAIAAQLRQSKAIPKSTNSPCVPCAAAKATKAKTVVLPGKGGKPVIVGSVYAVVKSTDTSPATPAASKQTKVPCKNQTLVVACSHDGRGYKLSLPSASGSSSAEFDVIDDGKEIITCTTTTVGPCGSHSGKVFDLNPDDSIQSKSDTQLKFKALHDPSLTLSSFSELFNLTMTRSPQVYHVRTDTCHQEESLAATINVYPQVDWDVSFSFGYSASGSVSRTDSDPLLTEDRQSQWKLNGELGVTVVGDKKSFGGEIVQDLQRVLQFANIACDAAEFFASTARILGGVELSLKYPTFSFKGGWGWKEIEATPKCGFVLDLTVGFSPLIGASAKVDILQFAITKIPVLGQIIQRVRELAREEVNFEIDLEVSGEIDGTFGFKEPLGGDPDASGTLSGKIDFKAEAVVSSKQHSFSAGAWFSVHWGFGAKVGASGGFGAEISAGHDGEEFYWQGDVKFDGLDVYALAAGGVGFEFGAKQSDEENAFDVPDGDSGSDSSVRVEGKIDTSGVEGNIDYEHVWHLLEEKTIWGSDEKHPLFQN